MNQKLKSIRPFIGAKNFETSRKFYTDLGFQEKVIDSNLSYFENSNIGFYLQNAYVKDWIDNTMIFIEVEDAATYYDALSALQLSDKYTAVKLIPVRTMNWGKECFLHDPSGILWHFGQFFPT